MGNSESTLDTPYADNEYSNIVLLDLYKMAYSVLSKADRIYKRNYLSKLEGVTFREAGKSATEDKSLVYLCLRKSQHEYYDWNTLVYVTLHELAHVIDHGYNPNHGGDFQKLFSGLLSIGQQEGYYNPNIPLPHVYCGIRI